MKKSRTRQELRDILSISSFKGLATGYVAFSPSGERLDAEKQNFPLIQVKQGKFQELAAQLRSL